MHIQFLEFLVDPVTKEPLALESPSGNGNCIESGFLTSSRNRYPIVRGIPRFVDFESPNYSKSFGYQWHKWPRLQFESENVGKPMEGCTRGIWESITAIVDKKEEINGKMIVDIGCGPGKYIEISRRRGAKVIGIDYSMAVEAASNNFKKDNDVCICQADALNLPLRENSIDAAFSIGVLHHTPDPEKGVFEAYRILADNGWFALNVYSKGRGYDHLAVRGWRKLFNLLWPKFGHYPPLIYTYFTVYTFRPIVSLFPSVRSAICSIFPFMYLNDLEWTLLDTFDCITPSYQSSHDPYEVFHWFKKAGFIDIEPTNHGFTSVRGVKKKG